MARSWARISCCDDPSSLAKSCAVISFRTVPPLSTKVTEEPVCVTVIEGDALAGSASGDLMKTSSWG